jgi:hypothetical protein
MRAMLHMIWLMLVLGTVAAVIIFTFHADIDHKSPDPVDVKMLAENVRCAVGHQGRCWCFVTLHLKNDSVPTGIAMTLAPNALCEKKPCNDEEPL